MTHENYAQYKAYNSLINELSKLEDQIKALPTQIGCKQHDYGLHITQPIKLELTKAIAKAYISINNAKESL